MHRPFGTKGMARSTKIAQNQMKRGTHRDTEVGPWKRSLNRFNDLILDESPPRDAPIVKWFVGRSGELQGWSS